MGEDFNDPLDDTLVLLALVLYRKDHGRYPSDIKKLTPDYIGSSELKPANHEWMLLEVDSFRGPKTYGIFGSLGFIDLPWTSIRVERLVQVDRAKDPEFMANHPRIALGAGVLRYYLEHDKMPAEPEQLRPYLLEGSDFEPLADHFATYDSHTVLCKFERDVDRFKLWQIFSQEFFHLGYEVPSERLNEIFANEPGWYAKIIIPMDPPIPPELKSLLKENLATEGASNAAGQSSASR